jgi:hypothetical protein
MLAWPFDRYLNVDCSIANYCKPIPQKQYYADEHLHGTFEIAPASGYLRTFASAAPRVIRGAVIDNAAPYGGASSEVQALMQTFKGSTATLLLGGREKNLVTRRPDGTLLMNCLTLDFDSKAGTYGATCFGPGWATSLTFTANGPDREMLDGLSAAIGQVADERKTEYRWFQVVMYPIFIYAFLLLSVLWWLAMRALRFVKAG